MVSNAHAAGEYMRPHFGALVQVASAGLRDSSARVRAEALDAVSTLVQWVGEEPEVRLFRELVPSLLQVGHPSPSQHKNVLAPTSPFQLLYLVRGGLA